jgi:hypothetical protein
VLLFIEKQTIGEKISLISGGNLTENKVLLVGHGLDHRWTIAAQDRFTGDWQLNDGSAWICHTWEYCQQDLNLICRDTSPESGDIAPLIPFSIYHDRKTLPGT